MTTAWLKHHGIKYHQLMLGKPVGDVWIDDRAMRYENNWAEITEKILTGSKK